MPFCVPAIPRRCAPTPLHAPACIHRQSLAKARRGLDLLVLVLGTCVFATAWVHKAAVADALLYLRAPLHQEVHEACEAGQQVRGTAGTRNAAPTTMARGLLAENAQGGPLLSTKEARG